MIEDQSLDTSNYPKDHELYSNALNARFGCVKDEFVGEVCEEVILLAPKCYSFKLIGNTIKITAKGVGKSVKKQLTHEDYKARYVTRTELRKTIKRMQSFDHRIFNIKQKKIPLSFFENKRAWTDLNNSLPYGHFKLKRLCNSHIPESQ